MIEKKKRKTVVPAGTQQETGVTRFIKKTKAPEVVKDARENFKNEIKKKKT